MLRLKALYTDRHTIYCPSGENKEKRTQFGRACQELGIQMIYARSPQAKGRVERWNGIYQDRLVKELRLKQVNTPEAGNQVLENGFLDEINGKFTVTAQNVADFHRPSPTKEILGKAFCYYTERKLGNDWTIRWKNRIFQLVKQSDLPQPKSKIEVRQYLDGSLHLFYRNQEFPFQEVLPPGRIERPLSESDPWNGIPEYKRKQYEIIRTMQKEKMTISGIAQHLGISRKTVRNYLKKGLPSNQKKEPCKKLLHPFYSEIRAWLLNKPKISATEVYQRIRKKGYPGGVSTVNGFVLKVKKEQGNPIKVRFSQRDQEMVQRWLRENPRISGKEVYRRLLVEGYTGSYETSQRFVRSFQEQSLKS